METTTTYVPPEILDDMDEDTIHARMMEALPKDIDNTEGGFAWDMTRPAAVEKADAMTLLNEIVQIFFPEWSYDIYLDSIAATVGLTRKSATAAEADLTVTGTAGTIIPVDYLFATAATAISENLEYAVTEEATIGEDGTATVHVKCTQAGTTGNVPSNSIVLMDSPMTGIETFTNEAAATGGTEAEKDDDLRERIKQRDQQGESSFVGNDADYKRWAQEVDGVGSVIVIPEWEGPGTGTVKLIVMDAAGAPASATIRENVYNHIISPDDPDERLAPIGAILTVETATLLIIEIEATVTLAADTEMEDVKTEFTEALAEYCEKAKAEGADSATGIGYIRYTRIGGILSGITGIVDYADLKLNGGTSNIEIEASEYALTGTITLTEASA